MSALTTVALTHLTSTSPDTAISPDTAQTELQRRGGLGARSTPPLPEAAPADPAALPPADQALIDIAEYAAHHAVDSAAAYDGACHCLLEALAGGLRSLRDPECLRLLGPLVPGATMTQGARVPGTSYELDPAMAAFNIGVMLCWERGSAASSRQSVEGLHPCDALGAILAVADYLARRAHNEARKPPRVKDLLGALIKAHEIQGLLALDPVVRRAGLDSMMLVRVACTAAVTAMLGGDRDQILGAISHAWIDGGLSTYRHAPGSSARRSWAAGDAGSRAVRLAFMALSGEPGYPSALSAPGVGLYDALCQGRRFSPPRPYASHMMEQWRFESVPGSAAVPRDGSAPESWRDEGAAAPLPANSERFAASVNAHFGESQAALIRSRCADRRGLVRMPVHEFAALWVKNA